MIPTGLLPVRPYYRNWLWENVKQPVTMMTYLTVGMLADCLMFTGYCLLCRIRQQIYKSQTPEKICQKKKKTEIQVFLYKMTFRKMWIRSPLNNKDTKGNVKSRAKTGLKMKLTEISEEIRKVNLK